MQSAQLAAATRRITGALFATQSMASAAFIATAAVNAIIGAELSGSQELAGLPFTLVLFGAASSAYPAGRLMQRFGRRPGLTLGFAFGMAGMLIAAASVLAQSFWLFMLGLLLVGVARGVTDQSRYAAADAAPLSQRARAISVVVFASTIGAVGGPLLVGPLGRLALALGLPELAGPMLGGAALFGLGGAVIALLLRPEPRIIAEQLAANQQDAPAAAGPGRGMGQLLIAMPAARLALVAMVLGQAVMVMVMSVTSLHMYNNGHGLDSVSLVIGAHTLGMFGLSMLTGALADRLGRPLTIVIGVAILVAGCLMAPLSLLTAWLALALFLVGLGWNLCYIAGSSLLADTIAPGERGRIQGASDLLVNLGSASGSLPSGLILARLGYGPLCLIGAAAALLPLLLAIPQLRAPSPASPVAPGD